MITTDVVFDNFLGFVILFVALVIPISSFWPLFVHPFRKWDQINWAAERPWMYPKYWLTPWLWVPLQCVNHLGLLILVRQGVHDGSSSHAGLAQAAFVLWFLHYVVWWLWAVPLLMEYTIGVIVLWGMSAALGWGAAMCAIGVSPFAGTLWIIWIFALSCATFINGAGYIARGWECNAQCKLHLRKPRWNMLYRRLFGFLDFVPITSSLYSDTSVSYPGPSDPSGSLSTPNDDSVTDEQRETLARLLAENDSHNASTSAPYSTRI